MCSIKTKVSWFLIQVQNIFNKKNHFDFVRPAALIT